MIVYKITNLINDKVYIGQTIRPLEERWTQHISDRNKFDYPLYRAINKYGKKAFKVETIKTVDSIEMLNKAESEEISKHNSLNRGFGYNILHGGGNYKLPQAVKDKISKSMLGKKFKSHMTKEKRSEIARANAICRNNRTITVKDKNDNLLYEGAVLSDCAKQLNIPVSSLYKWIMGMRKSKKYQVFMKEEN